MSATLPTREGWRARLDALTRAIFGIDAMTFVRETAPSRLDRRGSLVSHGSTRDLLALIPFAFSAHEIRNLRSVRRAMDGTS